MDFLDEAEGVVAPSISAVVWDDGVERFARAPDRVYDLASLTKVLCTTELAMRLDVDRGHPLLPAGVTIAHLLQHASGWPAWKPYFERVSGRSVVAAALAEPLVARPGEAHCYSDVGFLALGAVIEAELGDRIDRLWSGPLRWGDARSEPTDGERGGPVNDPNARAMGGIAPHAGLFGSAREVAQGALGWLDHPRASEAFARLGPGTHALGWDTPNVDGTSSAGPHPPADAVGHLGFTGTSVWMCPSTRRIAVLLTNRVALGPELAGIRALRRTFHQAAWA